MNQVFVCGTFFQIYVSILKTIHRADTSSKSLIILNDHTPEIEKIIPLLRENGYFDHHLFVPFRKIEATLNEENGLMGKIFNRNKNSIKAVEQNSDIGTYNEFIKHSEFNLFYLWGLPSAYFVLKYPTNYARVIEDGARNYVFKTSDFKHFKRKHILRTYIGDGLDDSVKEIQVQNPEALHKRIKYKGTKLELQQMQASLSPEDNRRILNVFMKDLTINLPDQQKFLLITQPVETKQFSEDLKVQLYNEILEQYSKDYTVYIKPHPRELTNYKEKLGRSFVEIPRAFPLEMFDLMKNISFDEGLTLYSSSLKNLNCVKKKIHLGKEYLTQWNLKQKDNP
jgi:Glycosyltransferase family 52